MNKEVVTNVPPPALVVVTPSNNPNLFQNTLYARPPDRSTIHGAGVTGLDLRHRIEMSFLSGLPDETRWAVAALLEQTFKTTDLSKDVTLRGLLSNALNYAQEAWPGLDKPEKYAAVCEIFLSVRNVTTDPENAQIMASFPKLRPLLESAFGLPDSPTYRELRDYALEIAESVSSLYQPETESNLFKGLVALLGSEDRSTLVSVHRALSRLCVGVDDDNSAILTLPLDAIHRLLRFLLVNDDELIGSTLDLLYQYSSRLESVSDFWTEQNDKLWIQDILSTHLVRLLTYKVQKEVPDYVRLPRRTKRPTPAEPPKLTDAIIHELLALQEPDRATNWIRASYEPDPDGEVTQISLWKAYEGQFDSYVRAGRGRLLPAVDFIKNVTTAFRNAAAMVVNLSSGEKRFIIKGIKPREAPVSPAVYNQLHHSSLPETQRRAPLPLTTTAALVLQNIARLQGGKELLRPFISDICTALTVNHGIVSYVNGLLATLDEA